MRMKQIIIYQLNKQSSIKFVPEMFSPPIEKIEQIDLQSLIKNIFISLSRKNNFILFKCRFYPNEFNNYAQQQINIIMKPSHTPHSYYMGMNCRPTGRPLQQNKQIKRNFINPFISKGDSVDQEQKKIIIHVNKNKKRVQQMMKYQNPFLKRKQSQQLGKRKRSQKSQGSIDNQNSTEYLKVTKINKLRTEVNEENLPAESIPITVELPQPLHKKVQTKIQNFTHEEFKKNGFEKQFCINTQKESVFNHFPSQLFISPVSKSKLSFTKRGQTHTRNYSYFFPSNRAKTEVEKVKWVKVKNISRPNSCAPRRTESKQKRVFNFDGTLENHQIIIPERPKTADGRKKENKYKRNIQYYDYQEVAKRCIKLKKERATEKMEKALKILPWSNEQKFISDIFEIECSTIRGQFLEQM